MTFNHNRMKRNKGAYDANFRLGRLIGRLGYGLGSWQTDEKGRVLLARFIGQAPTMALQDRAANREP